jgi:hypothetical protein
LNVYKGLVNTLAWKFGAEPKAAEIGPYTKDSIKIVALMHDFGKIGQYEKFMRNVQVNGEWVKQESYQTSENKFNYATHSENAIERVSEFIKLTREEKLAIRFHMGNLDWSDNKETVGMMSDAYRESALAFWLHVVDGESTWRLEGNNGTKPQ